VQAAAKRGSPPKRTHEVRDPIHVFVRLDTDERRLLDKHPLQRLRHIHQLALTYLVYPGATHMRFEHALGVMELAGRVFDVVTSRDNVLQSVEGIIERDNLPYWRRVLRMAALFHDVGHLPFSHAAEGYLLPHGWSHELLTLEVIRSPELEKAWGDIKVQREDVAKLAVGPRKYRAHDGCQVKFTDWEAILAEIIVGDSFGVDRMDYLLRDSHHSGVAYGRFDHYRLIDTMRILPKEYEESAEPALGVQVGGIHTAEALLLARYFMYTQLYFHPVRRAYDIHLRDFLRGWLPGGTFPLDLPSYLAITDNEVMSAVLAAAADPAKPGHIHAKRIVCRGHYQKLYERNPHDQERNPDAPQLVYEAVRDRYGDDVVRLDSYRERDRASDFPVLEDDDRIASSWAISSVLKEVPLLAVDYILIERSRRDEAAAWLDMRRDDIIRGSVRESGEETGDGTTARA